MKAWDISKLNDRQTGLLVKTAIGNIKPTVSPQRAPIKTKKAYDPAVVDALLLQCGIPVPVYEYRFHPVRKWRLDLAWVEQRVALEVQGGIFIQGRHTNGAALLKEWEKLNELACLGWRVLYCQPKDLMSEATIEYIKRALT